MMPKDYVSLLWPKAERAFFDLDDKTVEDLNLTDVFGHHEALMTPALEGILRQLPTDQGTIAYRQAILRDFDGNLGLLDAFVEVAGKFHETRNLIKFAFERDHALYNVLKRMEDSELIVEGLNRLRKALEKADLDAKGLINFKSMIQNLMASDLFLAYEQDLRSIRRKGTIKSIRLGLNLDDNMNPKEAIVLTLEEEAFRYTRPMKRVQRVLNYGIGELKKVPRKIFAPETLIPKENLNALEKIIAPAMGQLLKFIDTFNDAVLEVFEPMVEELSFYRFAIHMKDHLITEGYPLCQAVFEDKDTHEIGQLYNANLAYRLAKDGGKMVYNDIRWQRRHLYILTGANRGGKTTFTQALGQTFWLGMLGLFVPAKSANLPMVDGLFVHFPIEEKETVLFGRLGEECQRFSTMFGRMTGDSVLLMNETFSGTSHHESLKIARDALRATAKIGLTGLFNTHLHELAGDIQRLNSAVAEDNFTFSNLVSGIKENPQSFTIHEGEPLGKSYAHEIAVKYGISYEQLTKQA